MPETRGSDWQLRLILRGAHHRREKKERRQSRKMELRRGAGFTRCPRWKSDLEEEITPARNRAPAEATQSRTRNRPPPQRNQASPPKAARNLTKLGAAIAFAVSPPPSSTRTLPACASRHLHRLLPRPLRCHPFFESRTMATIQLPCKFSQPQLSPALHTKKPAKRPAAPPYGPDSPTRQTTEQAHNQTAHK